MTLREGAELMALVHREHVGFEQRVVHAAGERYAVVREKVCRELHVLADFPAVGALEPGPEEFERRLQLHLLRRPRVVVRERQVDRLVAEGECYAGKTYAHRLLADR